MDRFTHAHPQVLDIDDACGSTSTPSGQVSAVYSCGEYYGAVHAMLNRTKDSGLGMTVPLPVCTTYVNSCCSRSTSEYWDKQYEKGNWKQVLESTALTAILVLTGLFAYGGFTLLLWCVRARKPNQTQTTHGWHSQTSPGTPARPPDPRILYGEILRPCIPVNKVIRTIMHTKSLGLFDK